MDLDKVRGDDFLRDVGMFAIPTGEEFELPSERSQTDPDFGSMRMIGATRWLPEPCPQYPPGNVSGVQNYFICF